MHQTTIRFANDAWAKIEHEARASGVSAAQYVREATIARLAVGLPGHGEWRPEEISDATSLRAWQAQASAESAGEGAEALWAQARQVRKRAREIREASRALHRQRRRVPS
jgi:hypothetical protein